MRLPAWSRWARARENVPRPAPTSAQSPACRGTAVASSAAASAMFTVTVQRRGTAGGSVIVQADVSTIPAGPPKATRREWIGLAVIALPCFLYSMDLTVLNLAVPRLSEALRPSAAQLLWIIDIYGFLVAGSLITMGTLGDRIGRRRLLLIGAAAFGLISILAALSPTAEWLIASRALLGVAGATLAPSTLSLIFHMFQDPRERSVAIGFWIGGFS